MLLLVVPLLLFLLITWQVLADGPLLGLDERLSDALVRPDRASELLSDLGNVEVAVPVLGPDAPWHHARPAFEGPDDPEREQQVPEPEDEPQPAPKPEARPGKGDTDPTTPDDPSGGTR
ncbi:hypothetical protein [Streptomyces sp. E1N211]|uniref:hypothetical protein n=1 Tax=Streptomyces sp. E1N211 TaxID=1851876 RepID=UPI000EF70C96|nr:hypothetical protein [Streptomyces sp. E1N211]